VQSLIWRDPHDSIVQAAAGAKTSIKTRLFAIRFSRGSHDLRIRPFTEGNLSVTDVRGRRIIGMAISGKKSANAAELPILLPVTPGLYIVVFKGKSGVDKRVVPVL
jgi:hypothetical protein